MQPTRIHRTLWGKYHKATVYHPACQCRRHRFDLWVGKYPPEKEMATHSRILVWIIPWTEKPGGLQPVGSWGVRHDWAHMHTHMQLQYFRLKKLVTFCFPSCSLPELHPLIQSTHTHESPSSCNKTLYYKNYLQCLFSWSRNQTKSHESTFNLPSFLEDNFTGY